MERFLAFGLSRRYFLRIFVGISLMCTILIDSATGQQGCPNSLVLNGNFTTGLSAGFLGSGGTVDNWERDLYKGPAWVLSDPGCGDVGYIGMIGNIQMLQGIQQTLPSPLVQGHTYSITVCGRYLSNPPTPGYYLENPASYVRFRIRASNSPLQTNADGTLIGVTQDFTLPMGWVSTAPIIWTAPADFPTYSLLTINSENAVPPDTSYGEIDQICIVEISGGCLNSLVSNGNFTTGLSAGFLGSGGAVDNWERDLYKGPAWVLSDPGCGDVGYIGMIGNTQMLQGIQQTLPSPLVQGHTYSITVCGRYLSNPPTPGYYLAYPASYVRFRIRASNSPLQTNADGTLIGVTQDFTLPMGWVSTAPIIWTAPADFPTYSLLTINSENAVPPDTSYGEIDQICIVEISGGCPNSLVSNGNFTTGLSAGFLGSGGAVDNWERDLYKGPAWVLSDPGCGDVGYIGMIGNIQMLQGIQQTLPSPLVQGHTYSITVCGRYLSNPPTPGYYLENPASYVRFRIRASNSPLQTNADGTLIGVTQDFTLPMGWVSTAPIIWTAPADFPTYSLLTINSENAVPPDTSYGEIDQICIVEITGGSFMTSVHQGWNLISNPLQAVNDSVKSMYPLAISSAFKYNSGSGYTSADILENGNGYWLKFRQADTVEILGMPMRTDTIAVEPGWNMIGSVSDPIAVSSIIVDPPTLTTSQFFYYDKSYALSDTIYPWVGYWVKTNEAGSLLLSSDFLSSKTSRIKIIATNELPPPAPSDKSSIIEMPKVFALQQNYPNPFNPTTTIKYELPVESWVVLKVYNTLGQVVAVLRDAVEAAGYRSAEWNASNVANGLYFYKLEAASTVDPGKSFTEVKKMLLIK